MTELRMTRPEAINHAIEVAHEAEKVALSHPARSVALVQVGQLWTEIAKLLYQGRMMEVAGRDNDPDDHISNLIPRGFPTTEYPRLD